MFVFFSSRRRHTRCSRDWSSDVCSSDLGSGHSSPFIVVEPIFLSSFTWSSTNTSGNRCFSQQWSDATNEAYRDNLRSDGSQGAVAPFQRQHNPRPLHQGCAGSHCERERHTSHSNLAELDYKAVWAVH